MNQPERIVRVSFPRSQASIPNFDRQAPRESWESARDLLVHAI